MRILQHDKNGVTVVQFTDVKFMDASSAGEVGETFDRIAGRRDIQALVLDFRDVEQVTSSGIGELISLQNKVNLPRGEVKISGLSDIVREVFSITQIDSMFEIYDDLDAALASYA